MSGKVSNTMKHKKSSNQLLEKGMHGIFLAAASLSVIAVAIICLFLFSNGLPAIKEIGLWQFLTGMEWRPTNHLFSIFPMIVGSVYVTIGALIIGVPIGVLTAIYMVYYCSAQYYRFFKSGVQLLAGIPSVVYGFFGLMVLVPWIRESFGGRGLSVLAAAILLGMMILPTIISMAETSIRSVPTSYYEASIGLGASHERSIFLVMVPAAKSGILTGIVLGLGRAIGETMAVIMVAGNQVMIPQSLLDGVRTMTTNIVLEMGYATDLHRQALIGTAVILFVFILLINLVLALLKRGERHG